MALSDDDMFWGDSPRNSGENTFPFSQSEPMSQGNLSPENLARNDGVYGEKEGKDDWESDFEAEE